MPVAARTDQEIRPDVLRELQNESRVDQAEIGVEVNNSIVTLTGTVEGDAATREGRVQMWPEKNSVLETVGHSPGVHDVKDRLSVHPRY